MSGIVVLLLAVVSGFAGWALLRRRGTSLRVARLLAAAPRRSLSEAAERAAQGDASYVRLHGRIDSAEEFPGDDGTPLVFRRRRLQRGGRAGWQTFEDAREAVPFGLSERGTRVAIDIEALGDGLVVVSREAVGVAADVNPDHVSGRLPDLPLDTPVRLRVEQVSSVEHATAAGVPRVGEDGAIVLGPGMGRPLVLTTLAVDEAMRVLAGERRGELLLAAGLLAATPVLAILGLALLVLGL